MKKILPLLSLFALLSPLTAAAGDADFGAVQKADDTRIAAIMAADADGMNAIFSDDLTYTHSSGQVNHKQDFIKAIMSRRTRYVSFDYEARKFQSVAPGVVLMTGRAQVNVSSSGKDSHIYMSFLCVYRREAGVWRFLAWQSCHLTDASPPFPK